MKIVNVGLIGFGAAGKTFHEPIITSVPGLNLSKIYETNDSNIQILKTKYTDDMITNNIKDIFSDENIDLVVLSVPNIAHYDLAKQALESGKNVVVEKPFTVTSEEADKLINLAGHKNKILTVHQNRRWDSDFRTIEKIVKENLLGDLVEYEAHYDRFRSYIKENSWRENDIPGSGILYDLGAHLIDQAQCLFGVPEEIFADLQIQRSEGKTIDNFEIILHYPKVKVTLKAGMLVREVGPHFSLYGKNGSFLKFGMDVQEAALKKGLTPKNTENWGVEPESLWGKLDTEVNGSHFVGKIESETGDYRKFYKNVYKAILGEEEIAVKAYQARNTIKIIELAQKSSSEKQWVKFQ